MILRKELSKEIVTESTSFAIYAENLSRQLMATTVLNVLKVLSSGVLHAPASVTNHLRQLTAHGAPNLSRAQPTGS